ncbi:PREDICTED: armadillo repeat-containing protein 6 homolog [Nicrophorus vespilloides]|uniref:Armadillo repeat-containing protein 6 homolog n=1 Tax=Nicrophorus vespilloides TaxID=110193 RepID=A0ABM1N2P1_NICVS|nr:PREDICTED: armadillo repeat-containing protein 6 homolog [Nicrophorus vespilloides]
MHPVTQEMFDGVVKENMDEFGMDVDEAIEDTVKQFQAQGADLSKVIIDLMASSVDSQTVTDALKRLSKLVKENQPPQEYVEELKIIKTQCDIGLQYKVIAGREGAYNIIMDILSKDLGDVEVLTECFITLTSLMTKQPDLLNAAGIQLIITTLDQQTDENVIKHLLKWTRECCILHENNRQNIMDAGILDHLKPLMQVASASLLCDCLGVLRSLVLDDDIRVEFGRAHDHARIIASDTLCFITALLEKFKSDETLMNDVILTISSLLVRTEYCKKVDDAGGLPIILSTLSQFSNSDKLSKQCLKVLKALAGNDELKSKIIKSGAAPLIINALNKHKVNQQTAILGLGCISALTLRCPENSEALFKCGAPNTIVSIMELHPDNEQVQKNASWAIRNMVSRSRHQNKQFIELGVEQLLHKALKKCKKSEYDIKAALRDLECSVELKEEWTGKGGMLHTDEKLKKK